MEGKEGAIGEIWCQKLLASAGIEEKKLFVWNKKKNEKTVKTVKK